MSIALREDPDLIPLCPHCGREIAELSGIIPKAKGSARFTLGKRTIYACPNCRKILGISERKGFWAG